MKTYSQPVENSRHWDVVDFRFLILGFSFQLLRNQRFTSLPVWGAGFAYGGHTFYFTFLFGPFNMYPLKQCQWVWYHNLCGAWKKTQLCLALCHRSLVLHKCVKITCMQVWPWARLPQEWRRWRIPAHCGYCEHVFFLWMGFEGQSLHWNIMVML